MSIMFEVYYSMPPNKEREARIIQELAHYRGVLTFREEPEVGDPSSAICLTFEFRELDMAEKASTRLRQMGEHVEEIQPDYPGDLMPI